MKKFAKVFLLAAMTIGMAVACDDSTPSNSTETPASSTSEVSSQTSISSSVTTVSSSNNSSSSVSPSSSSLIPTLTGISLNTNNVKKEYNYGEKLTLAGLVVTASYSNNTTEQVTSGYTTNPAENTELKTLGENDVVVTYQSFTASFKITVSKLLTGIELDTTNVKKEYGYNETLDLTGLVVTAKYNDNSSAAVEDYTTNPAKGTALTNLGENTITVTYNGKTDSFKVNVSKVLTDIELDTTNVKKSYNYGDQYSPVGLKVYALYNDNSREEVTRFSSSVNFGEILIKDTDVMIIYGNFTKTFKVTVDQGSSFIDSSEVKTVYNYGEALDVTGLKAYFQYKDGTKSYLDLVSTDPAAGTSLRTIGKQKYHALFADDLGRQVGGWVDIVVNEIEETATEATLALDVEHTFENGVANVQAEGTPGSNYHPNFKLTKNSTAEDAMTVVNSKLRVKNGDVIENTESLGGVTSIEITGGNGYFTLLAGYNADNMYNFLNAESLGGDRVYVDVPNVNFIKLIGKYDNNPADIAAITFTYTRNAAHNIVEGTPKSIHTLTVNEGEYLKGSKTLTVAGNTVEVDGTTYTYAGIFYDGALFYANGVNGLLVKYVNDTAVIVRDTLNNYSSLSGDYTKVIPATKVEMFVNGVKTTANAADSRVEMKAGEEFTFSATCDAVPAEEPVVTYVDETYGEPDPYIGTYKATNDKIYPQDLYSGNYDEIALDPIVVTKENGKYYIQLKAFAGDYFPGYNGKYEAIASGDNIGCSVDEYLSINLNKEDKKIELNYRDDENAYVFLEGSVGYTFVSSSAQVAYFANGAVRALVGGDFYMSAKASNGLEAKYYVHVKDYIPAVLTVESSIEVKVGETYQLNASVNANATDKTILFESSDETIAKVDDNGLVTGVNEGTATIIVSSNDSEKTVTVTVKKAGATTAKETTYEFTDQVDASTHTLVVVQEIEATIDSTYHFTYKNGIYEYDENANVIFEIRVSGSAAYLDFIDADMVLFSYYGPIGVYDFDNGIDLTFVSEKDVTIGGGEQGQTVTAVTYKFEDADGGEHTLVVKEEVEATLDSTYHFTYGNGHYVYDEDSDCYFDIRHSGSDLLDYYDSNMTIFGYENYIVTFYDKEGTVDLTKAG